MAPESSPPLPLRPLGSARNSTPSKAFRPDDDELLEATVPCSPAAFLRDRKPVEPTDTQSLRPTQLTEPTQCLSQARLVVPDPISSSPAPSIVEIPASSPFQEQPKRPAMSLGSRLAPAGTFFRRPPQVNNDSKTPVLPSSSSMALKRSLDHDDSSDDDDKDIISIPSDNDDDLASRGDIRPTAFKKQLAAYAYDAAEERKTKELLRQLYDVFGDRYPAQMVKQALQECKNNLEDTKAWLQEKGRLTHSRNQSQRPVARSFPGPNRKNSTSSAMFSSPPRPPPKMPKRRLVQGLRKREPSSTASSPQKSISLPPPPSSDDPLVIDLVDDDADAYEAEELPSGTEEEEDRVLKSINESTLKELAAMTGEKEHELQVFVDKREFTDLDQARRVSLPKKPGARKSARVSLGEKVVDAVEIFLRAVTTIDNVVAECERKANLVKDELRKWDIDSFGFDKRQKPSTTDLPPSPVSDSDLSRPPIPKQPELMEGHCQMKPFQVFGLNWMSLLRKHGIGCILADEMGLGKTCQVISLISHLVESFDEDREGSDPPWPNLIVVPPSTYDNWLAEFEKFAPDLSVATYRGSQAERAEVAYEIRQNLDAYHVVLAPYSQFNTDEDIEQMQSLQLHAAIFDEGHKMKNPETKIYGFLRRISASWKMLLTGTPVQNNLLEMVSLLSFINPKMFEGYMEDIKYMFSQKVSIRDVSNGAFLYAERVRRAHKILEPFILQRRKDQVVTDMPRKISSVVYCEMSPYQREIYEEYEQLFRTESSLRKKAAKGRHNDRNNVWMQLRKAAIHPLLFRRQFTDKRASKMAKILWDNLSKAEVGSSELRHLDAELQGCSDFDLHLWCRDYPNLLGKFDYPQEREFDSGKVTKLLELVRQYAANGDRVLVFSKFSRIIEMLKEVLATQDIEYRELTGSTKVSERQVLIDQFNGTPSIPVFLLTTAAGGTGINLTAANKVVIFDQSDNPQDDIQAENRAHRLGQKREVEVVRLLSSGTIEELVYKACQKKIELADKVTGALTEEEGQETAKNMEQEVRAMMQQDGMTPP